MDIQKEKDLYLAELLEQGVLRQAELDDIDFKIEISAFHSRYLSARFIDNINFGWSAWQTAKANAVPEGFVLVEKELPESIAETMALERVNKPFGETDSVWVEITEKVYKERIVSKKWELWRDYKDMIEAQEQVG